MSNPFLAEIRIFSGNFAPKGWALCDGQLMPISQNTALFSLLGTTYGGNGTSNFALPNLQGAAPMQSGQGPGLSLRDLGETAGSDTVTLLQTEIAAHTHTAHCSDNTGNSYDGTDNVWSKDAGGNNEYGSGKATGTMSPFATSPAGGNQPHNNMQPYLALTFIIALQGVFPARS